MRSRAAGALPPEEHEKHLAAQRTIPTRMARLQARLSDEHRPYRGSDRRDPVRADLRRNPTRDQLRRAVVDKRDTRDTLTRAIRLCPTRWAARSFAAARISASVRGKLHAAPSRNLTTLWLC